MKTIKEVIRKLGLDFRWPEFILGLLLGILLVIVVLSGIIKATPEYFGTVGDWVSGIGALLAVCVSLILAYKAKPYFRNKMSLEVTCEIYGTDIQAKVKVLVENTGTIPIEISRIESYAMTSTGTTDPGTVEDKEYHKQINLGDSYEQTLKLSSGPGLKNGKVQVNVYFSNGRKKQIAAEIIAGTKFYSK